MRRRAAPGRRRPCQGCSAPWGLSQAPPPTQPDGCTRQPSVPPHPALGGHAWAPERRRAAASPAGGPALPPRRVANAAPGRRRQDGRGPALRGRAAAAAPGTRREAGAPGPRGARSPARARPVAPASEGRPPAHGHPRTGPEGGLRLASSGQEGRLPSRAEASADGTPILCTARGQRARPSIVWRRLTPSVIMLGFRLDHKRLAPARVVIAMSCALYTVALVRLSFVAGAKLG